MVKDLKNKGLKGEISIRMLVKYNFVPLLYFVDIRNEHVLHGR